MTRPRVWLMSVLLAVPASACGGDDGGATDAQGVAPASPAPGSPNATVPADVPSALLPAIGPVEVIGAALPPLPESGIDSAIDQTAPVVIGYDFAGEVVRIDPARPTMVVFLAHWCPHCNVEVPRINALRDAGRLPADLDIVAVSTSPDPGRPNFPPAEWIEAVDWTYPVIADGIDMERQTFVAAEAFGVTGFPFVTMLDAEGTVTARWSGEHEVEELAALIESGIR